MMLSFVESTEFKSGISDGRQATVSLVIVDLSTVLYSLPVIEPPKSVLSLKTYLFLCVYNKTRGQQKLLYL